MVKLRLISMALRAYVCVTEAPENLYKARITFSLGPQLGVKPLDVTCTLTRGRHDLQVYANGRALHPDAETRELIEHLVLAGARKIVNTRVDAAIEQHGYRVCTDTDDESGIYADCQYPGRFDTQITGVSRVIKLMQRKAGS